MKRKAFTLIELLVVISIIAMLLAILMPALGMVKEKGRQVVCASHLKSIGLSVTTYLTDNDDTFHFGGKPASELKEYFKYCSYGLNSYTNSHYSDGKAVYVKGSSLRRPSETIFAQDHIEQLMDGTGSDMFCKPPGGGTSSKNLSQWRGYQQSHSELYPNVLGACFRHSKKGGNDGNSNTLWLDGHVNPIKETDGEDVPAKWYTGGAR